MKIWAGSWAVDDGWRPVRADTSSVFLTSKPVSCRTRKKRTSYLVSPSAFRLNLSDKLVCIWQAERPTSRLSVEEPHRQTEAPSRAFLSPSGKRATRRAIKRRRNRFHVTSNDCRFNSDVCLILEENCDAILSRPHRKLKTRSFNPQLSLKLMCSTIHSWIWLVWFISINSLQKTKEKAITFKLEAASYGRPAAALAASFDSPSLAATISCYTPFLLVLSP